MAVKSRPDGYHAVTPYLMAADAAKVIAFARTAVDAQETMRLAAPGERIGHGEPRIGDSTVMLADASPEHPATPCMFSSTWTMRMPPANGRSLRALLRCCRWRTSFTAIAAAGTAILVGTCGISRRTSRMCRRMS